MAECAALSAKADWLHSTLIALGAVSVPQWTACDSCSFSRTIASLSILLVHICLMRFTAFHAHIPEYVFAKGQASRSAAALRRSESPAAPSFRPETFWIGGRWHDVMVACYACRPDTFWIPYDNQMTTSDCHPWKPDETQWPHPDPACGHWVWMEDLILLEALTLMVVSYAHFAVSITQEICASPIPLRTIPLRPIRLGSIRLRFSPLCRWLSALCVLCGGRGQLASGGDWKYARLRRATAGPAHVASHALVRCCMPHVAWCPHVVCGRLDPRDPLLPHHPAPRRARLAR